jgi:hypothetical protein
MKAPSKRRIAAAFERTETLRAAIVPGWIFQTGLFFVNQTTWKSAKALFSEW